MAENSQNGLLSSLVAEIKSYSGEDPLLPWLRGINRMLELLPANVLSDKLPRFLQKCVQTFESDKRYRNDPRYLRVWIQLMDYVDDAKPILRKMEKQKIGLKRATFYTAYALYYEKKKKFEDAERMYHLGVQNLAEPASVLHSAYEQFLSRMEVCKKRKAKVQEALSMTRISAGSRTSPKCNINTNKTSEGTKDTKDSSDIKTCMAMTQSRSAQISLPEAVGSCKGTKTNTDDRGNAKSTSLPGDETVIVKFVDSAIVGKSAAEDACHHGLVEPTINTKEAINAISNMFREPLETEPKAPKKSTRSTVKEADHGSDIAVYVDEDLKGQTNLDKQRAKDQNHKLSIQSSPKARGTETHRPFVGAFEIYVDGKDQIDLGNKKDMKNAMESRQKKSKSGLSGTGRSLVVHDNPTLQKDDTVIQKFIGSAVFSEPKVENACHHGLVDPTINMKEAMNDINHMFGKPLETIRVNKRKKKLQLHQKKPDISKFTILGDNDLEEAAKDKLADWKPVSDGFFILADEDATENSQKSLNLNEARHKFHILTDCTDAEDGVVCQSSRINCESENKDGLFEPTVFTKEAIADINKMFGRPLDF